MIEEDRCDCCSRVLRGGTTFAIGGERRCLRCAVCYRPMLWRSVLTASVVGSVLTAVNEGPSLLRGAFRAEMTWQMTLNYLVPFCVASWGALINSRSSGPRV